MIQFRALELHSLCTTQCILWMLCYSMMDEGEGKDTLSNDLLAALTED